RVYQAGGIAWLHGINLYGPAFPSPVPAPGMPFASSGLQFTYPPIAAVLFSLFAVLPWATVMIMMTMVSLAALNSTTALTAFTLRRPAGYGLAAATIALASDPVRQTITLGQVNLLLMALVAADCLVPRPCWPRGLLVGLAAAIKLTPGVFLLYFLARRDWRAAAVSAFSFVTVSLFGFVLAPRDSLSYWGSAVFDPARVGALEFSSNQSLRGAVHRLGLPPVDEVVVWLGLVAVVLVTAWIAMRCTDRLVTMIVAATAGLLCSPVSWSHHWVWAVPGLMVWWIRSGNKHLLWTAGAVFLVGPQWLLPWKDGREFGWNWWQHLVGDSYVLIGLAFLVWAATTTAPAGRSRAEAVGENVVLLSR
ncbi:MAG: DUF2029 domain-containing protein, partial [Kutzneria sp.]|nr:DUF2029 domain-containing protein [Kutzneria sp.]